MNTQMYRSVLILVPPQSYLRNRAFWTRASASLPVSPHTLRFTDREPATLPHSSSARYQIYIPRIPQPYSYFNVLMHSNHLFFLPTLGKRMTPSCATTALGVTVSRFSQQNRSGKMHHHHHRRISLGGCSDAGYAPATIAQVPDQGCESLACRTGESVADSTRRFRTFW